MSLSDDLRVRLGRLEADGLLRQPLTLAGPRGPEAELGGRRILVFCSNDYLGLASDPALAAKAAAAAREEGVGGAASRLIAGSSPAHRRAERALAELVGLDDALLFSSGYAANVGALSALVDRDDVVFSDALAHASLIDGARLSRARVHVVPHAEPSALEQALRAHRSEGRRAWVVTEALFSMDGDRAPLADLRAACDRHDAYLFVDEAHSIGVLGEGRGGCAAQGVRPDVLVGTLGKALGLSGAFVAGAPELRAWLENRARSYVFSTAVSPALAAVVPAAVELARGGSDRRARLFAHAARVRAELGRRWEVVAGESPIVPIVLGEARHAMEISRALLERGVFVQGIRPPTVPRGTSRLRLVPTAAHTEAHVDRLLEAFATLR